METQSDITAPSRVKQNTSVSPDQPQPIFIHQPLPIVPIVSTPNHTFILTRLAIVWPAHKSWLNTALNWKETQTHWHRTRLAEGDRGQCNITIILIHLYCHHKDGGSTFWGR